MRVKLTRKTAGASSGFREHGNPAIGETNSLPKFGEGFSFIGEPLDDKTAAGRLIYTSNVVFWILNEDGTYTFKTESGSEYHLEIMEK